MVVDIIRNHPARIAKPARMTISGRSFFIGDDPNLYASYVVLRKTGKVSPNILSIPNPPRGALSPKFGSRDSPSQILSLIALYPKSGLGDSSSQILSLIALYPKSGSRDPLSQILSLIALYPKSGSEDSPSQILSLMALCSKPWSQGFLPQI